MKILFHLGHPAHFHLFKNVIINLIKNKHEVFILIKKKDILEDLLKESGFSYHNILPKGRRDSKIGIAIGQLYQDFRMLRFCIKNRPDILIGTSVAISHVGKILVIPSINVNEDDAEVVPLYAKLAYPMASVILAPNVCSTGIWKKKTIQYSSYHELAYLHPNHFKPRKEVVQKYFNPKEKYFVIRFAKLTAHHDEGVEGLNKDIATRIIELLLPYGRVFITSERKLEADFEKYRIDINPLDIHDVMAYASMYIGDSQTMAAEAAVLGIPFIRFNDFVGRISYLEELENKYKLGFGIKTNNPDKLIETLKQLLKQKDCKKFYQERKKKMLSEKINYADFLSWFIENYPKSSKIMKENTDYQNKFK
tara:strand:+ start:3020 stop:4114 length:1095 start_codon:yes stop_codon:yes gene_type:complete